IVFAVVVATFLRWLLLEAYTIPTPSMEGSLLTGDFLFVSKLHYGARTPKTPLQLPLTHQKMWFTGLPSYLDWIQLPQYRLPHFADVKNNDVVVFNYPGFEENQKRYPTDLRTNYIKRCIAVGGDSLEIRDAKIFINGKPFQDHEKVQNTYIISVKDEISQEDWEELGVFISETDLENSDVEFFPAQNKYVGRLNKTVVEKIKKLPQVTKVELMAVPKGKKEESGMVVLNEDGVGEMMVGEKVYPVFPHSPQYNWNRDNFGPLWIPKEGAKIKINKETLTLYGFTIQEFEGYKKNEVKISDNQLIINGKAVNEYTFKQNYYFMMGDNRHNSLDSRYWGFVPADHVVGKALFVWMSWDGRAKWYKKIRWGRLFNGIR
ncbi:MAG: signal peptidase I, partial [Thermonemataceae bacterium]|nr:signal peptidase I [Thermonemataceae bacterium]